MYGVVEIKGHQYKVQAGDIIDVQKMDANVGDTIELDQVLFIGGDSPKVGTPTVKGAKVTAEVVRQARSRKIIVFKRKPGLSRTKNGHRQHYTALKIKDIKG
jgi:large subunit ribosomal protein L21